jgi:hypothetical protein
MRRMEKMYHSDIHRNERGERKERDEMIGKEEKLREQFIVKRGK